MDGGQSCRGIVELRGTIGDSFVNGFAEDRLREITAAHVEGAAASAIPAATPAAEEQAGAGGFAVAGNGSEDFACGGVDEASRDGDDGFGFFFACAENRASPAAMAASHAANFAVVAAEFGDGAENNGVDAEDAADFGGAGGIGAVAVIEILLGNNLVESSALDHAVLAVLDELLNHEIGDAFADVLVGAEDGGNDGFDGAVVKVHHGDKPLWTLRRRGCGGCRARRCGRRGLVAPRTGPLLGMKHKANEKVVT